MYSANTILTVYLAPKDQYSYSNFRSWHRNTKRRWRCAQVNGAEEIKVLENNRRHKIHYTKPLKIFGWLSEKNSKYKSETFYQDIVGDVYHDYYQKFTSYVLDWWGYGGGSIQEFKKNRNTKSIPNTPMLDVSIHLDKNSIMEKIYMQGMSYDEAISKTFKGKAQYADLLRTLRNFNIKHEGMSSEKANEEAIKVTEIIQRNIALNKNSPTRNSYAFMINYFNKFLDTKLREMMKININFWFLKEVMRTNPNLGFYVLGPFNRLMRIQGIVGKRGDNIIIAMECPGNSKKYKYEIVYSVDKDTKIFVNEQGFIPAKNMTRQKSKLLNMLWGKRPCKVDHRYNTEYFYDLILEGSEKKMAWFDAHHNVFLAVDYSDPNNLKGKDLIV